MKRVCDVLMLGSLPVWLGARQHSGVGNVLWGLSTALNRAGVSVVIAARGNYLRRFRIVDEVPIHGIGFSPTALLNAVVVLWRHRREVFNERDPRVRLRLAYAVYFLSYLRERVTFRLLHVHHVSNQFPVAARWVGVEAPIVAHIHSYTEISQKRNQPEAVARLVENTNRQMACVDHVVHVSKTVRALGRRNGVTWSTPDTVIHNGIRYTLEQIQTLRQPKRPGVVCFAGEFVPVKGIRTLLDALNAVDTVVEGTVWIGDGPMRREIVAGCAAAGIRAEMTGHVSNEEVLAGISSCGLMVVPSRSESFGQVYVEALLVGTPVIGFHEVVEELRDAFAESDAERAALAPFDSVTGSGESLATLVSDMVARRLTVPDALSRRIVARLHWSALVDVYRSVYDGLTARELS